MTGIRQRGTMFNIFNKLYDMVNGFFDVDLKSTCEYCGKDCAADICPDCYHRECVNEWEDENLWQ